MARLAMRTVLFEYDDVRKELIITLTPGPPAGTEDPAAYVGDQVMTIRLTTASVVTEPRRK